MENNENKENIIEEKEPQRKRISGVVYLIFAILLVFSYFAGLLTNCLSSSQFSRRLDKVVNIIKKEGIFCADMTDDEIIKAVTNTLLENDRYAEYYTPEEYALILQEDKGNYGGTGLSFLVDENGEVYGDTIFSVLNNSPAKLAGIKNGDKVVKVKRASDTTFTTVSNNKELIQFVSPIPLDEEITFVVNREGEFTEREFKLKKGKYTVSYCTYIDSENTLSFKYNGSNSYTIEQGGMSELDSQTAYIELSAFSGKVVNEFAEVIKYFKANNKKNLILDLRYNGGGFLNMFTEIASYLINDNGNNKILLASAKGESVDEKYYTSKNRFCSSLENIVVLANGSSASATECLIGAMLCYGDANFSLDSLILTSYNSTRSAYTTFGKGIMQMTYSFLYGGALKLTTAKIYWPDNTTCIHGTGIVQSNPLNCTSDSMAIDRAIEILASR